MGYNETMPEGQEIPLVKPTKHPEMVREQMREGLPEKAARQFTALKLLLNRSRVRKQELQQQNAELGEQAFIDPLTGAYNRRYFDEQLKDAFALTKRSGEHGGRLQVGVLMFDLDHFKAVNDRFGHEEGDNVLISFVNLIKKSAREEDVFARIGGEEFVLLIRGVEKMSQEDIEKLALRYNRLVSEGVVAGPRRDPITVSMGMSLYPNGAPIEKPEDLLAYADKALYQAKEGGRNQVVKFTGVNEQGEPQFSRVDVSPKG